MEEKRLVKPSELDIYYEPAETVLNITSDRQPAFLYEAVSNTRKSISQAFSGVLTTHEKVSNVIAYVESKVKGLYSDGLQDPHLLLVPGSIALATIGGAAAAGRGKRPIRRTLYASIFGGTAAAVTHRERTLDIATTGYYHTKDAIFGLYNSWTTKETITEKVEKENENKETMNENKLEEDENILKEEVKEIVENISEIVEHDSSIPVSEIENVNSEIPQEVELKNENIIETTEKLKEQNESVINENENTQIATELEEEAKTSTYEPKQDDTLVISEKVISLNENEAAPTKQEKEVETTPLKENENVSVVSTSTDEVQFVAEEKGSSEDTIEGDMGQSDPNDQDMYSTRK